MKNCRDKGKDGENIAVKFLQKKGYKILSQNYRTKYGEIDLICSKNDITVFVEVKTRSNPNYQQAIESINTGKVQRIKNTALLYLQKIGEDDIDCRFDVVLVLKIKSSKKIFHIENAF